LSLLVIPIHCYVADSLVKITPESKTVLGSSASASSVPPTDKPGASWTDKVMAVKLQTASQNAPLPQDEVEGVADDEWVSETEHQTSIELPSQDVIFNLTK